MGSHRDVVILPDDIDIPVGRMRDDIHVGIADEKVRHDFAHRELHGGHARGVANDAGRFDVRLSNLTPRLVSSCWTRWLSVDLGIRSVRPAAVNPPRSTTRTNKKKSFKSSIGGSIVHLVGR
jgi:hypothetical protein